MQNVNGSRFHLLLGRQDWGACAIATGAISRRALDTYWHGDDGALLPDDAVPPDVPHWDAARHELTLAPLPEILRDTAGEAALIPAQRRAGATDAGGNLYLVGDDGASITVVPRGEELAQRFWPDERAAAPARRDLFADVTPAAPVQRRYVALAVTGQSYLVAWWHDEDGDGADRFDLLGGGEGEVIHAHPGMPGRVIDLAPRGDHGLWALLEGSGGLVVLDADLCPCPVSGPEEEEDLFQPDAPSAPRHRHPAPAMGRAVSMDPDLSARQLVLLRDQVPLVLADTVGGAVLMVLDGATQVWRFLPSDPSPWHLIAAAPMLASGEQSLFLIPPGGNQAMERLVGVDEAGGVTLSPIQPHTYPLRRFGGRALAAAGGRICYDSGTPARMVPVVARRQRSYALLNRFETPTYDSATAQCLWDRIRIDAAIPPGTSVRIEARSAETAAEIAQMGDAGWVMQPAPYLNGDNGELTGKGEWALATNVPAARRGCWDLLLQGQRGRFCQLRVTLAGDGRNTPRLRALRLWFPRFSYVERFLPALYREEAVSADFLDRFLANVEGIASGIEGRIAGAQALLDPRTVPDGMIDWLASWLDLMLDPAWDGARKRLFLAHAMRFFGWRGTVAGVELALRIALDTSLSAQDFALERGGCTCPGRIRVVEGFAAHRRARRFAPSKTQAGGPAALTLADAWHPDEGSAGLWQRHAAAGGSMGSGAYPLFPSDETSIWAATTAAAFGFTPAAGAQERAAWIAFRASRGEAARELPLHAVPDGGDGDSWRAFLALPRAARRAWQDGLRRRYHRIERLNAAYAGAWGDFADIPIPAMLPDRAQAIRDWITFEGDLLPRRAIAHRFSVLLPLRSVSEGSAALADRLALARRIVEVEKPAHTEFDLRFYWAMNRVGEARLGQDSEIGAGSRAAELIPPALIGSAYLGSSFVAGPQGSPGGRARLAC